MRGEQDLKEALEQNLRDSGCNENQIEEFFELYNSNELDKMLILLSNHKKFLVKELHKNQKEIDDLDYLILDLKNNYRREN